MTSPKLLAEWFWIDRWTGSGAFELPMVAQGLYRAMLSQAWRRGAKLPKSPKAIRTITGCSMRDWKIAWPRIKKYWVDSGDSIVNETQQEIYSGALNRHLSAAKRGKSGAERKAELQAKRKQALLGVSDKPLSPGFTPLPPTTPDSAPPATAAGPDGPPPPGRSRSKPVKCGPSDVDVDEHLRDDRTPEERARCAALKADTLSRFGKVAP